VAQRILRDSKHVGLNKVSPAKQQFASTLTGAANRTHEPHRMLAAIWSCILFVFPLANGKYKYLKYRITILQAVLHG